MKMSDFTLLSACYMFCKHSFLIRQKCDKSKEYHKDSIWELNCSNQNENYSSYYDRNVDEFFQKLVAVTGR